MASAATAAVAAAAARARREVRAYFENARAFDAASAVPYAPPNRLHERQFDFQVRRGIVKESRPGYYWLDREALELDAARQARIAKILFAVLGGCLVIAVVLALTLGLSGS